MTPQLARPCKPETDVRNTIEEARKRLKSDTGSYTPPRRSVARYELMPGCAVILDGGTALVGPVATYIGRHGVWQAMLHKHVGKPWRVENRYAGRHE